MDFALLKRFHLHRAYLESGGIFFLLSVWAQSVQKLKSYQISWPSSLGPPLWKSDFTLTSPLNKNFQNTILPTDIPPEKNPTTPMCSTLILIQILSTKLQRRIVEILKPCLLDLNVIILHLGSTLKKVSTTTCAEPRNISNN